MRMGRFWIWGVAGLALAGCASGGADTSAAGTGTTTGGAGPRKSLKITMIAKSSTNPVFLSAKRGAEDAASEIGKQRGLNIAIDWRTPPKEDGQVQAQRIQQAVNEGADVVLLSASDAAKVTGAINDAVAKGVPVMSFDSDAPDSKRFAFYGADDEEAGRQTVDELAKLTKGKGNVAILAGNQRAPNLQKRVAGAKAALAKYPGMKYVGTFYHPETPQDAAAAVVQAMNANPQIDAWAMIGGWALFAPSLLSLDPKRVTIVAVDALPQQLPYVEKGIAPVLLAQPTYEWGNKSVRIIVDKVIDKKDVPVINKMALVKVTKASLGQWARQLKLWGFDDVDPKYLAMGGGG